MRIPIKIITNEILSEYKISEFEHGRYVYVQINKGMYGLVQAGLLANEILSKRLAKHGFTLLDIALRIGDGDKMIA